MTGKCDQHQTIQNYSKLFNIQKKLFEQCLISRQYMKINIFGVEYVEDFDYSNKI